MTPFTPPPPLAAKLAGGATLIVLPVEHEIPADACEVFYWQIEKALANQPHAEAGLYVRRNSRGDDVNGYLRFLGPCPLQVGETYYVAEELMAKKCAYGVKVAYASDGRFSRGRRIEIDTPDGGKHVEACEWPFANPRLPAAEMPPEFARTTFTVATVELRRVNTITKDECIAAGFEMDGEGNSIRSLGYGWWFPWLKDFDARHPRAYHRNEYCWFVSIDSRKGIER